MCHDLSEDGGSAGKCFWGDVGPVVQIGYLAALPHRRSIAQQAAQHARHGRVQGNGFRFGLQEADGTAGLDVFAQTAAGSKATVARGTDMTYGSVPGVFVFCRLACLAVG